MFKENVNVKQQIVTRARAAFTGRISARTQTHVWWVQLGVIVQTDTGQTFWLKSEKIHSFRPGSNSPETIPIFQPTSHTHLKAISAEQQLKPLLMQTARSVVKFQINHVPQFPNLHLTLNPTPSKHHISITKGSSCPCIRHKRCRGRKGTAPLILTLVTT